MAGGDKTTEQGYLMAFATNFAPVPSIAHLRALKLINHAGEVAAAVLENQPGKAGSLAVIPCWRPAWRHHGGGRTRRPLIGCRAHLRTLACTRLTRSSWCQWLSSHSGSAAALAIAASRLIWVALPHLSGAEAKLSAQTPSSW
ncbi:hypothetical protein FQR65_LT19022 [Abscondita terminalis]|nr:hypothetical protein FQR65_LT19022 [Abscondita terminalis]